MQWDAPIPWKYSRFFTWFFFFLNCKTIKTWSMLVNISAFPVLNRRVRFWSSALWGAEQQVGEDFLLQRVKSWCVSKATDLLTFNDFISGLENGRVLHHDAVGHFLHFFQQRRAVAAVSKQTGSVATQLQFLLTEEEEEVLLFGLQHRDVKKVMA